MKRHRPIGMTIATLVWSSFLLPIDVTAGICPPAPGVEIPQAHINRINQNPTAFEFKYAWLKKTERIRSNREEYIAERGFYNRDLVSSELKPQMSVSGTLEVPVFMVKFSNTGADPYPTSTLQTKLFDGPFSPRTLTEYYSEISYGDFSFTGTVYGWTTMPQPDTYYEGYGGCNGTCTDGKVEQLILTTLLFNDVAVDFGDYDNDGPDGVPNSGDDDGYVDFVAFVHPEAGGECGNFNIWSHRWHLSGWSGSSFTTNDPAAGGGNIIVEDYVIQPAFDCNGVSVVSIGIFCHEFGHALGLSDYYDTNGGSAGIGHWGLMGAGNWNSPASPAHMAAHAKADLGWATVVYVEGKSQNYVIPAVETSRTVYRLDVMDERWRRASTCAISGGFSMRCGLTFTEGTSRGWLAGDGYADMWDETVYRDFTYDSQDSVTFTYDYTYSSEFQYDHTRVKIDVGGTVSTVFTYTGIGGAGNMVHDLTPYLDGSGVSTYRILFQFESDRYGSDRDGLQPTTCGPFVFDNVTLVGGGVNYSTSFELREDGWCVDMSDPAEYFLVENRQPILSDVNLYDGGGLAIWHVNQDTWRSIGNTGGNAGGLVHGVDLEQADGLDQLGSGGANRGDSGDPYPGSTNNTSFTLFTSPSSFGENASVNNASVLNISANPGDGGSMTADMTGGYRLPVFGSSSPASAPAGSTVVVSIVGSRMASTVAVELVDGGTVIVPTRLLWVGKDLVFAEFDLTGASPGFYDLTISNPINSCTVVTNAFEVQSGPTATPDIPSVYVLRQNYPNPFNPTTVIPFSLKTRAHTTLKIYDVTGRVVRTLVDGMLEEGAYASEWDGRDGDGRRVASGVYFYKIMSGGFSDVRKLVLMK